MQKPTNKKPFIFYYVIVLAVVVVLNIIVSSVFGTKTKEVSYSDFVQMTNSNQISIVEVQEDQIAFALKSDTDDNKNISEVYVTGKMDDPESDETIGRTWSGLYPNHPHKAVMVDEPSQFLCANDYTGGSGNISY